MHSDGTKRITQALKAAYWDSIVCWLVMVSKLRNHFQYSANICWKDTDNTKGNNISYLQVYGHSNIAHDWGRKYLYCVEETWWRQPKWNIFLLPCQKLYTSSCFPRHRCIQYPFYDAMTLVTLYCVRVIKLFSINRWTPPAHTHIHTLTPFHIPTTHHMK